MVDDVTAEAVYAALERIGVDVGAARASGSFELITKREAYLRDGYFAPEGMIDFLRERTNAAKADGFTALRLAAEMTWALGDEKGVERLVEYEAKLNHFFEDHECLAACQYHRSRFPPETMRAVIHTHPTVVVGQTIARNLFYIPPIEYLNEGEHRTNLEIDRMLRQLTALEQTQTALLRSEKLAVAGRIAASVAHEINNPLEAVTNLLYLAQGANSVEEARGLLAQAQSELDRLGVVARQTLGFYRETSGPQTVILRDIVRESNRLLQHKFARKTLNFANEIPESLRVKANYGELRQVLINLLDNAVDASMYGGRVWARAEADSAFVTLQIGDDGTGIEPEILGRIFEPFFSTKEERGNGLGLWVVQDLVARQGGTIQVESHTQGESQGTVFSILLPAD